VIEIDVKKELKKNLANAVAVVVAVAVVSSVEVLYVVEGFSNKIKKSPELGARGNFFIRSYYDVGTNRLLADLTTVLLSYACT